MKDLCLPNIPTIRWMHCDDHTTYVAPYEEKQRWIDDIGRGLVALPPIITTEFPAEHIAMVKKPGQTGACERMVGLSVSLDPESPINRLVERGRRHGVSTVIQHVAYSVDPKANFEDVRSELEFAGVDFMTPVLEHSDPGGATLRQMFVACNVPFGPFIEIVQRTTDLKTGLPFQGFNAGQIDTLYRYYNAYSLELLKKT